MSETPQDLRSAYETYRTRLFGALGKLAKQGFVVPPYEGLDLIHDFFVEAWDGIVERYDPNRASLGTYVYAAFVRFARPRIVRLQRFRERLMDTDEIARLASAASRDESEGLFEQDLDTVREVLWKIPKIERLLLLRKLGSDQPSERQLAEELALSRHRVRELLAEALGHIIVELGRPRWADDTDWTIALALWRDGRSPRETALELGLPLDRVHGTRARLRDLLASGMQPRRSERDRSETVMSEEGVKEMLERAVASPGDTAVLRDLRERGKEVLRFLEGPDAPRLLDSTRFVSNPSRAAEIYEAIADADSEGEDEDLEELFRSQIEDEESIGYAYSESLVQGLPPSLRDFAGAFEGAPRIDSEERQSLSREPSVIGGLPESARLTEFGLTPATVLEATEAVSRLVKRFIERGGGDAGRVEIVASGAPRSEDSAIDSDDVVEEIARFIECAAAVARPLLAWLSAVASYKPLLFSEFRVEAHGTTLRLLPYPMIDELYERWGTSNLSSPEWVSASTVTAGSIADSTLGPDAAAGDLPEGFAEFLDQLHLAGTPPTPDDVRSLKEIRLRGRVPRTADAWRSLYELLLRSTGARGEGRE